MKLRAESRIAPLQDLGLSPLEADIYAFLARQSPSSGYRIAQALGRPVGNIYKAIESLEDRGAVMTADDDGTRVARAVPLQEFASRRRRELEDAVAAASDALSHPPIQDPDALIYQLRDAPATYERARTIIRCATRFIVAVVTPVIAEELAGELARAAHRGVPVAIKAFGPISIPGVRVIQDPRGSEALDLGPGQWLMLSADGAATIDALFDLSGDHFGTAHWSENPLVAWNSYTGVISNLMMALVRGSLASGGTADQIRTELESMQPYRSTRSEGKSVLIRRFRNPAPSRRGRKPNQKDSHAAE